MYIMVKGEMIVSKRVGMVVEMESLINIFKKKWLIFIATVSWISLVLLFVSSFIFKEEIVLQTMNSWVSLILGLIAVVLSVISMILSFYNTERTNEISEQSSRTIKDLNILIDTKLERLLTTTNKFGDDLSALKDNYGNTLKSNYSQTTKVNNDNFYSVPNIELNLDDPF